MPAPKARRPHVRTNTYAKVPPPRRLLPHHARKANTPSTATATPALLASTAMRPVLLLVLSVQRVSTKQQEEKRLARRVPQANTTERLLSLHASLAPLAPTR